MTYQQLKDFSVQYPAEVEELYPDKSAPPQFKVPGVDKVFPFPTEG